MNKDSELIDVGIIKEIDFKRELVDILTPCESIYDVKNISAGDLRLSPIGDEIGKLKAGSF